MMWGEGLSALPLFRIQQIRIRWRKRKSAGSGRRLISAAGDRMRIRIRMSVAPGMIMWVNRAAHAITHAITRVFRR
jgi:hypothetical protein